MNFIYSFIARVSDRMAQSTVLVSNSALSILNARGTLNIAIYRELNKNYATILVMNPHSIQLRMAKKHSYSDPVMLMGKLRLGAERRFWNEWGKDRALLMPHLESWVLCHTRSRSNTGHLTGSEALSGEMSLWMNNL